MEKIEKAKRHIQAGEVEKGLTLLEKAVKEASDEEKYAIALQYEEWGHLERAEEIFAELFERYPEEGELQLRLAEIAIDLGRENEALERLHRLQPKDPEYPRALLLLAELYQMQGLDEVAERKLIEARRLLPERVETAMALARFYSERGDYQKSIPFYEAVLKETDSLAGENVRLGLAEALAMTGRFEEALDHFDKGLDHKPDLHRLFSFGLTAYYAGVYEKARRAFTQVKERDPEYPRVDYYLAKSHEKNGESEAAYRIINEAVEKDPYFEEALFDKGMLEMKLGYTGEAEKTWRDLLHLNPTHQKAVERLAQLYDEQRESKKVILLLSEKEQRDGLTAYSAWLLAKAYREEEQLENAINHFQEAYDNYKNDPYFLEDYGDTLLEAGRLKDALNLYKKAFRLEPSLLHLQERIDHFENNF